MTDVKKELEGYVYQKLNTVLEVSDDELYEIIDDVIYTNSERLGLSVKRRLLYKNSLYHSIRKMDILSRIMEDPLVTEVMINGHENIFVEKSGKVEKLTDTFESNEKLMDIIQQIVGKVNRRVNASEPIVDARLEDGSRVNVVLDPVSLDGPSMTIRRFPEHPFTMEQMISFGSITKEAAEFLKKLVEARYNIFILGGTGSGKTTFLNVLSSYIPSDERVITIEDAAELQLTSIKNLVRLEVKKGNTDGKGEISIRDLIKSSLRMRPDRIVVGEIRGSEAVDMLQAMNTGHDGSLSTGHANSVMDMLTRLEMMVLMGMDIPLKAIREQIVSAIDILVQVRRLRDGKRKVTEISELMPLEDGHYDLNVLFKYDGKKRGDSAVLERTDNPLKNTLKWEESGFSLDI